MPLDQQLMQKKHTDRRRVNAYSPLAALKIFLRDFSMQKTDKIILKLETKHRLNSAAAAA